MTNLKPNFSDILDALQNLAYLIKEPIVPLIASCKLTSEMNDRIYIEQFINLRRKLNENRT